MSCACSRRITRPSLNNDGLTSSASSGGVMSDTFVRVSSAVESAVRAASTAAWTARSTRSSSSPSTRWSGAGAAEEAVTPRSCHGDLERTGMAGTDLDALGWSHTHAAQAYGGQSNTAHQEGQRERPDEAPATGVSLSSRSREVADDNGAN